MAKIEQKWQVLLIICVGIFMSTLDGSILNIANPTIAKEFSVSIKNIQWVVTAYMLVITATLIFFGKLGDKIGSSKIYSLGFLVFALGSFLCSLSPSLYFLIGSRVVQAFGGSMMMATGMGIVSNTFPNNERGKALGLTGSMVGIGNMTGPGLGGFLVAKYSWPIIFLINIPIGLTGYYFAKKYLPKQVKNTQNQQFDYVGTILFAVFAVFLVMSLSNTQGLSLIILFIAIVSLLSFWVYEKRILSPMLDFELFKIKTFVYGNILGFFAYTSQTFIIFLIPFYLEQLLLFSPAYSGLLMTIPPVTMAITAPIAGSLSDKYGAGRLTSAGFFVLFSAHLLFSGFGSNVNLIKLIGALFLSGLGMGLFGSPNNSSILGAIPPSKAGYAGGFISTVRNFSFSIGISLSAGIFSYILSIYNSSLGYTLAYSKANQVVYLIAAGLTFIGLTISLITKKSRTKSMENDSNF